MAISGKIKIWTARNVITLEEQLITVKVGQSIDWCIDRFKKGSSARRPRIEKDRTRTRRSWHNILEACSGCQHFMLVVSESTCGRNCNSSRAMPENRAGVLALLKKVLERRSNNRQNTVPRSRGEVLCACAENKGNYLQHIMTRNWKQNRNRMWKSASRTWRQAFYCPLQRSCLDSLLYFFSRSLHLTLSALRSLGSF